MEYYLILFLGVVILAIDFCMQKMYQAKLGATPDKILLYNFIIGILLVVLLPITGFDFGGISLVTIGCAIGVAVVCISYTLVGFRVINLGGLSYYTLFLMSGGMIVPYLVGVILYGEAITPLRVIGLLVILGAMILNIVGKSKPTLKVIILSVFVFLLNGLTGTFSSLQSHYDSYSANIFSHLLIFTALIGIIKAIISAFVLVVFRHKYPLQIPQAKRKYLIYAVISAVTGGLAYILQIVSLPHLPNTVIFPIVSGGAILLTNIADYLVFKNKLSPTTWLSTAMCLVGTCMFL